MKLTLRKHLPLIMLIIQRYATRKSITLAKYIKGPMKWTQLDTKQCVKVTYHVYFQNISGICWYVPLLWLLFIWSTSIPASGNTSSTSFVCVMPRSHCGVSLLVSPRSSGTRRNVMHTVRSIIWMVWNGIEWQEVGSVPFVLLRLIQTWWNVAEVWNLAKTEVEQDWLEACVTRSDERSLSIMFLTIIRASTSPFLPRQVMVWTFCTAFEPGTCTIIVPLWAVNTVSVAFLILFIQFGTGFFRFVMLWLRF